jgi:hypothetical protein
MIGPMLDPLMLALLEAVEERMGAPDVAPPPAWEWA